MFKLSKIFFIPLTSLIAFNAFATFEEENLSPNLKAKEITFSAKISPSQIKKQIKSKGNQISSLRLKGPLKAEGLEQLNRSLPSIKVSEFIAQNGAVNEDNLPGILSNLEDNPNLTHMNLSYNKLSKDAIESVFYFVSIKPTLKILDLGNDELSKSSLKTIWNEIRNNSSLTKLNLSGNSFSKVKSSSIEKALIKNQTLTSLNLSSCNLLNLVGTVGDALSKNLTLTEINLSSNGITDEALHHLFMGISQNVSLKKIDLSHNKITGYRDQANPAIKAVPNEESKKQETTEDRVAKKLERNEEVDWFSLTLQYHPSLQTLSLSDNRVGLKGIKNITDALINSRSLELVELSDNKIPVEGAEEIDRLFMENGSIKLNIDDNRIPGIVVDSLEKMYPSQILHQ